MSLLAAERDPRIKAVAALSGWGSIADSTDVHHTLSQEAMLALPGRISSGCCGSTPPTSTAP